MTSTYEKITREIEALKKKAETARKHEAAEMVALIKSGIALYGLTAQDLGLTPSAKAAQWLPKTPLTSGRKTKADAFSAPASKYSDGAGRSWSGRGPRPAWVKAAIDAGRSLDDMLVGRIQKPVSKKSAKPAKKAMGKQSKALNPDKNVKLAVPTSKAKYKDDGGNSWSGRGPKPGWLRVAIDTGKLLEDFLV